MYSSACNQQVARDDDAIGGKGEERVARRNPCAVVEQHDLAPAEVEVHAIGVGGVGQDEVGVRLLFEEETRHVEPRLYGRIGGGALFEHPDVAGKLLFDAWTIELDGRPRHQRLRFRVRDDLHRGERGRVDLRAVPVIPVPVRVHHVADGLWRDRPDFGEYVRRRRRRAVGVEDEHGVAADDRHRVAVEADLPIRGRHEQMDARGDIDSFRRGPYVVGAHGGGAEDDENAGGARVDHPAFIIQGCCHSSWRACCSSQMRRRRCRLRRRRRI
jgi:hypothetical protein